MHNNVSLMATAYQPDFNNPALHLRIYPRGLNKQPDKVYRMRVASERITDDGVLEVTLDSSYEYTKALKGKRADLIRNVIKFDTEGKRIKMIRVKIHGVFERNFEVPVHNRKAPAERRSRGIYRGAHAPGHRGNGGSKPDLRLV